MKLQNLIDIVNEPSFDTKNNQKIIELLIEKFQPFSKEILKIKNPNSNIFNLLIGLNTKLQNVNNAIVLSGHIDTVPADTKKYKTNPLEATLAGGKLFGLGVIDMKCFFASILDNIEVIKNLSLPVVVAITGDEETTFEGIKQITKTMKAKNINPFFSIIGEPTSLDVCVSSKSCYEFEVTVLGKGCHSSAPKNGINANYIISKLASFIEKISLSQKNTTASVGLISGGEAVNIVSPKATLNFDIRSDSTKKVQKLLKNIEKFIKKLKNKYKGAEFLTKTNFAIPALQNQKSSLVSKICNTLCLAQNEFKAGAEASYFQELGGDAIIFGAGNLELAHKPNEYLLISDYEKYNELLIKMLGIICKNV